MEYRPNDLRRLQQAELSILKEIDALCERHNIPYFLDSGSALGAVRHGGFIPWDDDMDIGMLRSDYERFLDIAARELSENCDLLIPGKAPHYAAMFAKVMRKNTKFYTAETVEAGLHQGVFVDVFPYDDLSDEEAVAKSQLKKGRAWQSISYLYHAKTINVPHRGALGAAERLACRCSHYVVRALLTEQTISSRFSKGTRNLDTDTKRCVAFAAPIAGGLEKARLFPTKRIAFEDTELPVPADTDYYLEKAFGDDWNQLPPLEKRRNHAPIVLELPKEERQ